jgi:hypothetical protein
MFSLSERSNSPLSNEYKIIFLACIYVELFMILWQRLYLILKPYTKVFQFICDFNKNLITNIICQYLLIYNDFKYDYYVGF